MSDPDNVGTFGVVGNTITYSVGEGSPLCDTDQGLVGEVELISPGELQEAFLEDECAFTVGAQFSWNQGSPANYIDTKPPPRPPPDADSPSAAFEVEGVWLIQATPYLLHLAQGGSYRLDDQGLLDIDPADAGT